MGAISLFHTRGFPVIRTLTIALLLGVSGSAAFAVDIEATSAVDAVTVFPQGAEITRIAKVSVDKGDHVLIFRDLPAEAVEGSIRVEGNATGKLEIGSVDTRRLFVPQADAAANESERRNIERDLEAQRDQKATLDAQVRGAETQNKLIEKLAELPSRPAPAAGSEKGEDWTAILGLIATGTADAQRALLDAQVKMRDVDRKIQDLENKLGELEPAQIERTEAKVFLSAQSPLEADVTIRYQVVSASWTPLYDVRLATGSKTASPKLDLIRRAAITQSSGEAWDNVALTLSTTRPSAGASAPELFPLTVDFEPEMKPMAAPAPMMRGRDEAVGGAMEDGLAAEAQPPRPVMMAKVAQRQAAIIVAPFQALYAVPGRLAIPTTGEAKRVQLLTEAIAPELAVRTVPKQDAKAYLYAKFALPKGSPLLPGEVSLFRDGTFVGTGRLPLLSPSEEHELGFGVDDLVKVRHALLEEKRGETGLISSSKTDSRSYRLTVKSMHERAIALSIVDQIPVSENQEIKVDLTSKTAPTKQNVDDKRGVLSWETKLEPDQEQVVEFGYRVSWPAAKSVVYGR
jgi:uncharacterized protein (TIGR02231 family)